MIKMVAFDIDGTLYSRGERVILDSTFSALRKLKENGILVTIATGRVHHNLMKGVLSDYYDYMVAGNGHILINAKKDMLFQQYFDPVETQLLVDFCHERELGLILKMDDACYLYANHESFNIPVWGSDGVEVFYSGFEDRHLSHGVNCAFVRCTPQDAKDFEKMSEHIGFVQTGNDQYDVYYKGLNKAVTLEYLLGSLGLSWENCMAIGDGANDMEMIVHAGVGIAMGDGNETLKEHADYVTKGSREDGIYFVLEEYGLL